MTNKEINAAYIGNTEITKFYLGDNLVWGGEPGPDYSKMPLTFNIISGGTITWRATSAGYTKEIQYSVNDGPWVSITSTTAGVPISLNTGDIVKFQGDGAISTGQNTTNRFRDSTIVFEVYGNIMSLIDSTGYTTATTAPDHSFRQLFQLQTGLTSAENLVLPATTIGTNVYKQMFYGCTNLTTAPALPAETLPQSCYEAMFQGCTSLTTAPELPATTLAANCYRYMFYGCTSLTTAPELPATTLATSCYLGMFRGCTSLTSAPELPATTLAQSCYSNMFYDCTSLTRTPSVLSASTLADSCYYGMFRGCTSLTSAPELPATTLASTCYQGMFSGCTSLTAAPVLPATKLEYDCYDGMFNGCTSLTTAPELPATTLAANCYDNMFYGCTNLNYIKCLAINWTGAVDNWVSGVASTGTFVKHPNASWRRGDNGIPDGWTVIDATE